jgi:hypothetical protein
MDESSRQSILDEEHLRLLRVGYFIQGGTTVLMALFALFYIFIGVLFAVIATPNSGGAEAPPRFIGYFFALFGGVFFVSSGLFATLQFLAAQGLGRRRSRTLCLICAGFSCLFIPYGTVLGVCTFVVLSRPSVRALFTDRAAAP